VQTPFVYSKTLREAASLGPFRRFSTAITGLIRAIKLFNGREGPI